jgi:hypothetical protein
MHGERVAQLLLPGSQRIRTEYLLAEDGRENRDTRAESRQQGSDVCVRVLMITVIFIRALKNYQVCVSTV